MRYDTQFRDGTEGSTGKIKGRNVIIETNTGTTVILGKEGLIHVSNTRLVKVSGTFETINHKIGDISMLIQPLVGRQIEIGPQLGSVITDETKVHSIRINFPVNHDNFISLLKR